MTVLAQLTQESTICGLEVLESVLKMANLRGKRGRNIGAWTWGLLGKCREVGQMGSEEVGVLRNLGKQAVWLLRRLSAGEVIGGTADEPDVEEGEEDEEEGEEDGEKEEGEVGDTADEAEVPDSMEAADGSSPHDNTIATAAFGTDRNNQARQVSPTSDADLAKAKLQILDSLGHEQAQIDSAETNGVKEDDIQHSTTIQHPVTEVEEKVEGRLVERTDDKEMIHATLDMLITIVGEFYGQRDLLDGRLLWDEMP